MDLSKELADTNDKWKNKNEEIAGINQELAEIGWAAMDGDSDFEEEEAEQEQLNQQLWEGQEGHYQEFAHRQARARKPDQRSSLDGGKWRGGCRHGRQPACRRKGCWGVP
eukprot:6011392-Heterocapsa_arctica.AAC.1